MDEKHYFDFVIIGSGMGGAAAAHVLKDTGRQILILERGDYLKQEKQNWDISEVAEKHRYDADEVWYDGHGNPFNPRIYYNVGGNSKVYGAAALRLRKEDFASRLHSGGSTVDWPFPYETLAPFYDQAELLLGVRGEVGEDPTEPERGPFPLPRIEHEPEIERLADQLRSQGLHPIHLPLAIDQGPKGRCQKGSPCDGFPCMVRAKGDAENRILRPLLLKKTPNVNLWTNSYVDRLDTDESGKRVVRARVRRNGQDVVVEAGTFIVSAGAVNSAALLLRSKNDRHPTGLANSSGQVGRNFMSHNNSVILALSTRRKNPTNFQKTLAIHDFYNGDHSVDGAPLGAIQMRGKVKAQMLKRKPKLVLRLFPRAIAERSVDLWVMSEDLPNPENRVTTDDEGRISLTRRLTNIASHRKLLKNAKRMMHRAGYPICIVDRRGASAIQHQCGTVRFGSDPGVSVLDQWCRTHDVENLYVIDSSFFPSSGAVNPSLTILAQALRAAEHIKETVV
ncbi:MAG TPA: GMC family oxidoreductase [Spirochaetia bacterium]|nr:GMC family oxidoreductase [Spirochaetia bacterium]